MKTELTLPPGLVPDITFIMASATSSVQVDQTSTTLLYFSPRVIRPSRYCCSNSLTWLRALLDQVLVLASGTIRSSLPNEIPALQA